MATCSGGNESVEAWWRQTNQRGYGRGVGARTRSVTTDFLSASFSAARKF